MTGKPPANVRRIAVISKRTLRSNWRERAERQQETLKEVIAERGALREDLERTLDLNGTRLTQLDEAGERIREVERSLSLRVAEIDDLKAQLAKSKRNDSGRDPRTGQFVTGKKIRHRKE